MGSIWAAADIGSNTCHLLVGDVQENQIQRLENVSDWLSLGEIVARENRIPVDLADQLIATLRKFSRISKSHGAERLYVFATEAMRVATNHDDVLDDIKRATGIGVDLITPELEAEFSLQGVLLDCAGPTPMLLVEVGGGSAQVAFFDHGVVSHEVSLPLGTGKLIASLGLSSPPTLLQHKDLVRTIETQIELCRTFPAVRRVVASGGIARGIVRALHPDADPVVHVRELEYAAWAAQRLDIQRLMARFNIKAKRAATIFPGAHTYLSILQMFRQSEMRVSAYGVREGALLQLNAGKI